tara:strand:+ start:172 stop:477 length:306 start_codon:yes stop_codon:yes gene_type:complete
MSTAARVVKRTGPKEKPKTEQERARERASQHKQNVEAAKNRADTKAAFDRQLKKALAARDKEVRNWGPDAPRSSRTGPTPSWHTQQGRQELKRQKNLKRRK